MGQYGTRPSPAAGEAERARLPLAHRQRSDSDVPNLPRNLGAAREIRNDAPRGLPRVLDELDVYAPYRKATMVKGLSQAILPRPHLHRTLHRTPRPSFRPTEARLQLSALRPLIAPSNTAGAVAPARRKPAMGHFPNGTAPTRRCRARRVPLAATGVAAYPVCRQLGPVPSSADADTQPLPCAYSCTRTLAVLNASGDAFTEALQRLRPTVASPWPFLAHFGEADNFTGVVRRLPLFGKSIRLERSSRTGVD